jgi:hypothetical protein
MRSGSIDGDMALTVIQQVFAGRLVDHRRVSTIVNDNKSSTKIHDGSMKIEYLWSIPTESLQ